MKRKALSSISILGVSLAMGPIFIMGWIIGVAAGNFGGGKSEGQRGRVTSIVIPIWKWKIHLHHWLCSLGLVSVSSVYGLYIFNPYVTYGILGGLAFQGIYSYNDWYKIVHPRHQTERIE